MCSARVTDLVLADRTLDSVVRAREILLDLAGCLVESADRWPRRTGLWGLLDLILLSPAGLVMRFH